MQQEFDVVIERDSEGYYLASVPALRGCHTQARSPDDQMERVKEAIELCLEVVSDEVEPLDFVGAQRITLPEPCLPPPPQMESPCSSSSS